MPEMIVRFGFLCWNLLGTRGIFFTYCNCFRLTVQCVPNCVSFLAKRRMKIGVTINLKLCTWSWISYRFIGFSFFLFFYYRQTFGTCARNLLDFIRRCNTSDRSLLNPQDFPSFFSNLPLNVKNIQKKKKTFYFVHKWVKHSILIQRRRKARTSDYFLSLIVLFFQRSRSALDFAPGQVLLLTRGMIIGRGKKNGTDLNIQGVYRQVSFKVAPKLLILRNESTGQLCLLSG